MYMSHVCVLRMGLSFTLGNRAPVMSHVCKTVTDPDQVFWEWEWEGIDCQTRPTRYEINEKKRKTT